MLTFIEIQQFISKRYNLDAATAAETTKQIVNDMYAQHLSQKCLADVSTYLDYYDKLHVVVVIATSDV